MNKWVSPIFAHVCVIYLATRVRFARLSSDAPQEDKVNTLSSSLFVEVAKLLVCLVAAAASCGTLESFKVYWCHDVLSAYSRAIQLKTTRILIFLSMMTLIASVVTWSQSPKSSAPTGTTSCPVKTDENLVNTLLDVASDLLLPVFTVNPVMETSAADLTPVDSFVSLSFRVSSIFGIKFAIVLLLKSMEASSCALFQGFSLWTLALIVFEGCAIPLLCLLISRPYRLDWMLLFFTWNRDTFVLSDDSWLSWVLFGSYVFILFETVSTHDERIGREETIPVAEAVQDALGTSKVAEGELN